MIVVVLDLLFPNPLGARFVNLLKYHKESNVKH